MTDQEKNVEFLNGLCHQWGTSLLGTADLSLFKKEDVLLPAGTLDRLPFAISLGYHLSDSILEGIEDAPTPHYFHHYQRVNILLDTISLIVSSAIQEKGYQAMPIAASQIIDWKNQRGHLSHKHVARTAGLGWIGRNNLLVNGTFGSRIRLVTILTDLPLEFNSPLRKDCGSCRACIKVCPVEAIKEKPEDFDHLRCYEQLRAFSKTLHFSHNICGICVKTCRGFKGSSGQGV
ncbi:MAG: epoxyqueuosine reductase [Deltaproteobacteria bacterium]|nr:epoxyqueuosine reductase [Deltaproteobacteria bacterium]MBM4321997.1 epoxyqueuosine reductase [Deltaproteobacteria bacterium]MBM4346773.1 epoxyqueuosine reductase [Deltaproteobacteria bacterium]